jgi:PIN domain nuclease of toxin-antitoxin system
VKLLLDTHALLWFHEDDPKLSRKAARAIEDPDNQCLVSHVSIWEMAIKVSLGKLRIPIPLPDYVRLGISDQGFSFLPIEIDHLLHVSTLPFHHGDPFDRLLVAQCLTEGISLVSHDAALEQYGITRIW